MAVEKVTPHWGIDAVKSLGIPTSFLCVVVYMIWSAGEWASAEVVLPLFKRQIDFIDSADKVLQETRLAAAAVREIQVNGSLSLKRIEETTEKTAIAVGDLQKDYQQILEVLKEIEDNTRPGTQ